MTVSCPSNCPERILMVGCAVPDEVMEQLARIDRFPAVQSHKLSWSVIRGLEGAGDVTVDVLSSLPVSTYPNSPLLFAGCTTWERGNGSRNTTLPFVNLLLLKHLTRFLSCLLLTSRWLIDRRHDPDRIVLMCGLQSAHMLAVLLAVNLFGGRIVTLVTDPPSMDLPGESRLTRFLRRIDRRLLTAGLRAMDGLVVLTWQLADHFAPGVPALVMEGVLSERDVEAFATSRTECPKEAREPEPFIIVYAGLFLESYGLGLLLDAFAGLSGDHCQLWLCGNGPMAEQVIRAAERDSRITCWGYVPHTQVLEMIRRADVLVNPRPSQQGFTAFSFPSKTLEYLASGKPVICARLPGIPEEYFAYLQILEDESADGLTQLLCCFRDMPADRRGLLGELGRDFVLARKTEPKQGWRMREFLRSLTIRPPANRRRGCFRRNSDRSRHSQSAC
jgi:glycosyltransferase involved in cell wall biosynthesis